MSLGYSSMPKNAAHTKNSRPRQFFIGVAEFFSPSSPSVSRIAVSSKKFEKKTNWLFKNRAAVLASTVGFVFAALSVAALFVFNYLPGLSSLLNIPSLATLSFMATSSYLIGGLIASVFALLLKKNTETKMQLVKNALSGVFFPVIVTIRLVSIIARSVSKKIVGKQEPLLAATTTTTTIKQDGEEKAEEKRKKLKKKRVFTLEEALQAGDFNAVKLFVDAGADLNLTIAGENLLNVVLNKGFYKIAEFLASKGCQIT
jgi:hypothetical protein